MLAVKLVGLWFLAWTPYATVALMGIMGYKQYLTPLISSIPALFCKAASCINPFLYFINHPRFKKEFYSCFGRSSAKSDYMQEENASFVSATACPTGTRMFGAGSALQRCSIRRYPSTKVSNALVPVPTNLATVVCHNTLKDEAGGAEGSFKDSHKNGRALLTTTFGKETCVTELPESTSCQIKSPNYLMTSNEGGRKHEHLNWKRQSELPVEEHCRRSRAKLTSFPFPSKRFSSWHNLQHQHRHKLESTFRSEPAELHLNLSSDWSPSSYTPISSYLKET